MSEAIHPTEQEEVMAYLDGELSADRAAAMAAHLRECADCESLAASLRGVSHQLAAWTVGASPTGLNRNVGEAMASYPNFVQMPRLLLEPVKLFGWLTRPRMIFAVAGVACALLVVVVVVSTPNLLRSREAADRAAELGRQRLAEQSKAHKSWLGAGGSPTSRQSAEPAPYVVAPSDSVEIDDSLAPPPRPAAPHAQTMYSVDGQPVPDQPLIARTASLTLVVRDFGPVEASVKGIADRYRGYIANLNTTAPQNAARQLTATLKIPAAQLEAAIADLKQLGRVEREEQSGEDVTKQYTDLAAHLKNSRITEERLLDVLRNRTGKMKDILETEQEIERVRGEIEELEGAQRGLQKRIEFATVQLSVSENYKASLEVAPPSTGTRFHNAAVSGLRSVMDGTIGFALWLLEAGPSLLVWAAILFFPARWAWRRWRGLLKEAPEETQQ